MGLAGAMGVLPIWRRPARDGVEKFTWRLRHDSSRVRELKLAEESSF